MSEQPEPAVDGTADFVAQQMQTQSDAAEAEGVSAEQRDAFMRRAMAESRRMSGETAKSEAKRREMYAEMGQTQESMAALTREHIAQVALSQEAEAGAAGGRCRTPCLLYRRACGAAQAVLRAQ
jgi:hypothetical protein